MTQQEKEDQLILALCQEAGPDRNYDGSTTEHWADEEHIRGFRSNHDPEQIARAARGNALSLITLRNACGLPLFSSVERRNEH